MMVGVWGLAATVVGLREALRVSQGRAVLVTIMALIPFLVAFAVWFAMEMPRWLGRVADKRLAPRPATYTPRGYCDSSHTDDVGALLAAP